MENLLAGRGQILGEASTLFTSEKTANYRARVVEWINELVTPDNQEKCDILVKIQETICGSCMELLDEFLEHILSMSHDSSADVRKQVICFLEQICKVKVEFLPQIVSVVSMLLRDRSPQVIKRAIQACGTIYKNGFQWICSLTESTDSIEQTWNVLGLNKALILDLIDNDNDGIRTNAIKFLQGVVTLQTYPDEDSLKKENDLSLDNIPDCLKFLKKEKLEEEALNIFDILLKFHGATHISSVNLIALTGSLSHIAKLRPKLMGPVVQAFKHLNANLPPTLTDSQVSSVKKSLKMQLLALLKNKGSYEYQSSIRNILGDLGASNGEIQRAIPKMDKTEQMRRQKRILENATVNLQKRMRLSNPIEDSDSNQDYPQNAKKQEMEVDSEELQKQKEKSNRVNEKFLAEHLRSIDKTVTLIVEFLPKLPNQPPSHFLKDYTPIKDLSVNQQITAIGKTLGEQMTQLKIGPGLAAFTKDPPMRPKRTEKHSTESMDTDEIQPSLSEQLVAEQRKEEAAKKLRENMERAKEEQELIERMKQKAKTLKLQEITKPLNRQTKEKFLLDAVKRILEAERKCIVGGVSARRRKIVTILGATFPDNVRYLIFEFIMAEIKSRIDLAFSWLFEEYCLLQGFTGHSYVKSENRPDYAYNELINQLIEGIIEKCDFKDKITLLRRIYMEAPLIPDSALTHLIDLCLTEEYSEHCMGLLKQLAILKPPRKNKIMQILLNFSVHSRMDIRDMALIHIISLHKDYKILQNKIENFALDWVGYLEKENPPACIFSEEYGRPAVETAWKEELVKICLSLAFALAPYQPEVYLRRLVDIYSTTPTDVKRVILRGIDVPIKKISPNNKVVLSLIKECSKGSEALLIRMVHNLTEKVSTPHPELVACVKDLYERFKDVRFLIPIMNGLTRLEIVNALPKLLSLNQAVVKEVFNRLLGIGQDYSNQSIAATPIDVLVALHTIDVKTCDIKAILRATAICLNEKNIYTQEVLTVVLQQLVEVVPIPTLLMRTMIQSHTIYPRMTNFIFNLLQRLILKQVWKYKVIWDGFLKCIQRLKPHSLPILLQLPGQQLVTALQECPDLRQPLLEYAEGIQDEPMSGITPQVLDIINGKTTDVFVTDESGGYITLENIKKEIEDSSEISTISTVKTVAAVPTPASLLCLGKLKTEIDEPLPPGEG